MIDREFYNKVWENKNALTNSNWSTMINNSPAPKHRRRIIRNIICDVLKKENIYSIADVGCGNGALLNCLYKKTYLEKIVWCGYDISDTIINENKKHNNIINWKILNIENENIDTEYDIIICSEVLEHLNNWEQTLIKLIERAKKYCIISVPSGKIFYIDKLVGHKNHFNHKKITSILQNISKISYRYFYWGFPFHIIYKYTLNINPENAYRSFASKDYSPLKKFISAVINFLFFLNIKLKFTTNQMFIIIKKTDINE
jgi:SAM-dependent methyltransferase